GVFHQIVARRLEDEVSVFFDGQLIGTQLLAPGTFIGPSGNPLLIGARNGGQNHPVDGLIDEVAIWTRGISNDDISATFNQGNGAGLLGSQIPEPTSLAILGIGLVVFGFARRKHGFLPSDSH
ncbi:MAG: PEP-CTERM sorting domain-containing protein, partial [Rhodospirillaceae bacterium]|nr:PEP-CTERM sorting domain-containing protein [Rhodospirillaceae bacterium]